MFLDYFLILCLKELCYSALDCSPNLSFYVGLSIISGNKFIVCYLFSCKNPTQNNKFIVLYHFCLNKITATWNFQKSKYCLNETIIFLLSCCAVLYLGQKKCYRRPLQGSKVLDAFYFLIFLILEPIKVHFSNHLELSDWKYS